MDKIKTAIIPLIIIIIMILFLPSCAAKGAATEPSELPTEMYQQTVEIKKTSAEIKKELGIPMKLVKTNSKTKLVKLMEKCKTQKAKLKKSYPDESSINYDKYKKIIDKELIRITKIYKKYKAQYKEIVHFEKCAKAYPIATKIWKYLRKCGFNNYVCAGILGNMMTECGGQTFDIQPMLYDGGCYGICQWMRRWYPSVWGQDLDYQLKFLKKTMPDEFNNYGSRYYRGFNYKAFCNLQNEQSAAYAFAKCYERCASQYYAIRATNAAKAYKYFAWN